MGFFKWLKNKGALRDALPVINLITEEYWIHKQKHPKATHEEAILHAIRWRFNRAFFGSEKALEGSNLYGKFSDDEIFRILKQYGHYASINKAAAFVAGLQLECDNLRKKGIEPLMWDIARHEYNLSGVPWKPRNIEEVEKRYWKEMESKGLILKGNENDFS